MIRHNTPAIDVYSGSTNKVSDYLLFRKVVKLAKQKGIDENFCIAFLVHSERKTLMKYLTEPELFNRFIKKDNFTPTKTRKYEKQNKK